MTSELKSDWDVKVAEYQKKSKIIVRRGVTFINTFEVAIRLGEDVKSIQWKAAYGSLKNLAKRWGRPYWFKETEIDRLLGI
ncbi:hypothetical protein AAIR98_000886 [Elusimicrobium simillimum]|uniref:hypothetical protein n=1 Tax=Elusimicrobium simillimum TaxID=3143438 RepID=UPI003C6F7F3D